MKVSGYTNECPSKRGGCLFVFCNCLEQCVISELRRKDTKGKVEKLFHHPFNTQNIRTKIKRCHCRYANSLRNALTFSTGVQTPKDGNSNLETVCRRLSPESRSFLPGVGGLAHTASLLPRFYVVAYVLHTGETKSHAYTPMPS